jgi:hypothetical protein
MLSATSLVILQLFLYLWAKWNEAILREFRFPNNQEMSNQIDILPAEAGHFSDTKPEPVEKSKDRFVGNPTQQCMGIIAKTTCCI